ncbi:MAG: class I SAM-dependent methyltransferase [Planctomycetota bacterium]|jgi:2-polyprenyl-3-methyl-5-hydroxy-6-metoxy-1,4-benzoquinol methylase
MPLLSGYARKKRIEYCTKDISRDAKILEVGCGDGWFGKYLIENGWQNYVGLDLAPPADVVGDIRDWRKYEIEEESFDVIIAFEVVEHVNCFQELFDILKPGGLLVLTSPVPHLDWLCKLLELAGLNQKRTSPHRHLVYFDKDIPFFEPLEVRTIGFMMQCGRFRKPR